MVGRGKCTREWLSHKLLVWDVVFLLPHNLSLKSYLISSTWITRIYSPYPPYPILSTTCWFYPHVFHKLVSFVLLLLTSGSLYVAISVSRGFPTLPTVNYNLQPQDPHWEQQQLPQCIIIDMSRRCPQIVKCIIAAVHATLYPSCRYLRLPGLWWSDKMEKHGHQKRFEQNISELQMSVCEDTMAWADRERESGSVPLALTLLVNNSSA